MILVTVNNDFRTKRSDGVGLALSDVFDCFANNRHIELGG